MAEFKIDGRMTVRTLKENFKKEFGELFEFMMEEKKQKIMQHLLLFAKTMM